MAGCALHSSKSDVGRRIAQSLHYALVTGKKAAKPGVARRAKTGVVLIVEKEGEERFWDRMNAVIENYNLPIKTYLLWGEGLKAEGNQ